MSRDSYRFRDVWTVRADAEAVFATLADVDGYPAWWPDVRDVRRQDGDSGDVLVRAVLPVALRLRLKRAEEDTTTGTMRVAISGDLEGYCGAQVVEDGDRTVVWIEQDVVLCKRSLLPFEPVIWPMLRANHAAMMWRGQRGLRRYLA
ncbi:SRPBCC family protein [Haloechinothrix halophila]|uniref:SRPBCC family protein n=1 Tax=Haloechinothrix halophila TaxID=1069073 RepID=UPI0005572F26|nr:SRPBCC family protein [Haloechinothrix halophila]